MKNIFCDNNPKINISSHINKDIHKIDNFNLRKINWFFYHLFLFDKSLNNNKINYHVFIKNTQFKNIINDIIYYAPNDFHILYFDCFKKDKNNNLKFIKTSEEKYKYGYIISKKAFQNLKKLIIDSNVKNWENILSDYSKKYPVYSYKTSSYVKIKNYSLETKTYHNPQNYKFFKLPMYWINMDNSIFRRIFFRTFIAPYFENNKRFEGHNSINDDEYKNKYSKVSTPGQWGCLKSHYNISEYVYLHKIKLGLVMEDDIYINIKFIIKNMINFNRLPNDWNILQLVTSNVKKYNSFDKRKWKYWDPRYWCTAFYLINYEGAEKTFNSSSFLLTEDNRLVADFHLYKNCITYTYCKPLINFNNHNYSIIDKDINKIEKDAIKYINNLYKLV